MGDTPKSKDSAVRDKSGKIAVTPKDESVIPSKSKTVLETIIPHKVSVEHKTDDDTILDVKIGNPLRRITQLLEEIKKQKAFSFSLKGSLGVAGIAMVITTFGIFGGTKAFCSKGVQSHIGQLHQLQISNAPDRSVIVERAMIIWDALTGNDFTRRNRKRVVLVKDDQSVITVSERVANLSLPSFQLPVIVTGDFDSCSQTITVNEINGVEYY